MKGLLAMGRLQSVPDWGLDPMTGTKAHYIVSCKTVEHGFLEGKTANKTLCGRTIYTYPRAQMLHPGNYPRCGHCEKKLKQREAETV